MKGNRIRDFLISQAPSHPHDLVRHTAATFRISRQAVSRHVRKLIEQGALRATGATRNRRFELALLDYVSIELDLSDHLEEHEIWRTELLPRLSDVPENALRICEYGFTEMFNNVIDHSEGGHARVTLELSPMSIQIAVDDDGVGIFSKIQKALGLVDQRHAILELAKGKVTTDPSRHTGEGIFFTSRAVEQFSLLSGALFFGHLRGTRDWLIENTDNTSSGTTVHMLIDPNTERTLRGVFDQHATAEEDFGFTRTVVPVSLLMYGRENLVSRSQAKRLLSRFDRFREVVLDFDGVEIIGQAFADEIFRVYALFHPDVTIHVIRTTPEVDRMIRRARGRGDEDQLRLI